MAAIAVFMMMAVACAPVFAVIAEDKGTDAAVDGNDKALTVTVKDAGAGALAGLILKADVTAQGGLTYSPKVTDGGDGTYTFTVNNVDKDVTVTVLDSKGYTFADKTLKMTSPNGGFVTGAFTADGGKAFIANEFTVSGTVTISTPATLLATGVTVSYNNGSTVKTMAGGKYNIPAAAGTSVKITGFSKLGVQFPGFVEEYKNIRANCAGNNITGNSVTKTIILNDAGDNVLPVKGATLVYTLDGGRDITITSDASGTCTLYGYTDAVLKVKSVTFNGMYTFSASAIAAADGPFSTTAITIKANEYTASVKIMDSTTTSLPVPGISVSAAEEKATTGNIKFVMNGGKTDASGTAYFTYTLLTKTTPDAAVSMTVTAMPSATYPLSTSTGDISVVESSKPVGKPVQLTGIVSSSFVLKGAVDDSDGGNNALFAGTKVAVIGTGCKINGSTSATVIADASGSYSFTVAPSATPANDKVSVQVADTSNAYGFTYDVTKTGGAQKKDVAAAATTTADALTLKAVQSAVKISGTAGAAENAIVDIKVNGKPVASIKTTTSGAYELYVAAGSNVELGVNTVSEFSTDTVPVKNAAFGKAFDPAWIQLGPVNAAATQNFTERDAATVTVTVTGATVATDYVTLQYTVNGVITTVSKIGTGAFTGISMPAGSVFAYTVAGTDNSASPATAYITVSGSVTVNKTGIVTVDLVKALTATIVVKGPTAVNDSSALAGVTVKYQLSDSAIIAPVYDMTTVTDAFGKVSIPYTDGQYLAFQVQDSGLYTFGRTNAASGQGNALAAVASIDVTAQQTGAIKGYIRDASGIATPGVGIGFETYTTVDTKTGVVTATVRTDSTGFYLIPVVIDSAKSIDLYPVLTGYEFSETTTSTAEHCFTKPISATTVFSLYSEQTTGMATIAVVDTIATTTFDAYKVTVISTGKKIAASKEPVAIGTKLLLTAQDSVYDVLNDANGAEGNAVEKLMFDGWYFNGKKIADIGNIGTFTVTESGVLEAKYTASFIDTTPVAPSAGIDNMTLIIGIIAVVIALLAVVYTVISLKKE